MKFYKSFMFSALAAVAALATSCSDEGYWDAYTPEGAEYSFAQAANSYSYLPTDEIPEAYDMTTEAVVAKVMWTLPQCQTAAEFKKIFLSPIGNDRI